MDEFNKNKDRIGRLERGLYSRKHVSDYEDTRTPLSGKEQEVGSSWKADNDDVAKLLLLEKARHEREKGTLFKKILLGSIIFFLISLGIAAYIFFGGGNLVSANNIDIQVQGPTTTAGGEDVSLDVVIKNTNRAELQGVNLTVEYPPGSRVSGDVNTELVRQVESIGTVPANGEARKTIKSVLFGEKESIKQLKMTLEYRIQGSSATFYKDKNYEIAIKSSPVIVTVDYPKEVNSNQNFDFNIQVTSNSAETLKNVILRAEYPFGFSFGSANPSPTDPKDNTVWQIGDLASAEKRTIRIHGSLEGQNEEERTFRFSTGISSEKDPSTIGAAFSLLSESIHIKKPFIGLDIAIKDDTSPEAVVKLGEKVQTNIIWANNLPTKLLDVRIEAKLSGDALDRFSIIPGQGGYYRSVDNTIVWDKTGSSDFANVDPGYKGVASFAFASLSNLPSSTRNPQITIAVTASGNQVVSGGTPLHVSSDENKLVKINSALGFLARALHSSGPFENMGPIPPKADKETTYTIVWDLSSSLNDLSNTTVSATLPPYVKWNALVNPSSEKVLYDPLNSTVTWNAGDIRAGTGSGTPPREVAFQVSVTPSLSQIGSMISLLTNVKVSAKDLFSQKTLEYGEQSLNSNITSDPAFHQGDGVVVK